VDVARSISDAADTIEAIIDAAERLASEIRSDAQQEAERFLDDAEREADRLTMRRIGLLSKLSDSVIERTERLRRESDEVVRALEDAMRALAATVGDRPATNAGGNATGDVTVGDGEVTAGGDGEVTGSESATLRAARLAIAGSGRDEISVILGREYGIRNPAPILDQLFGPS
jgi:hypothetical protein